MNFGNSQIVFYLAGLILGVTIFYCWAEQQYKRLSLRFAYNEALRKINPFYGAQSRRIRILLNIAVVVLISVSLLRPQLGTYWQKKKKKGLDILFALDTSRSMMARDIKPDRLSFAKEEIKSFVKKLEGDRVGIIAFSGEAFLHCPLTMDYDGLFLMLDNISVGSVSRGGTSLSLAIEEAVRNFNNGAFSGQKILVVISDGENTEGDVGKAIEEAKQNKIRVFCIGVGSKEGDLIPYIDEDGKKGFLKDKEGEVVRSRLDEATLKELAAKTEGMYVHAAPSRFGLDYIYEKGLSEFHKREVEEILTRSPKERFQFPLAVAVFAFMIEMMITLVNKDEKV